MSTSYNGGAGIHLQNLFLDETTTAEQKSDCLKLLKVVLKNLADPVKSQDHKYRQLKTSNPKIQSKILPCPSALDYLKAIGFQESEDGILKVDLPDLTLMQASLQEVTNALDMVSPKEDGVTVAPGAAVGVHKKPRMESQTSSFSSATSTERLSEKQKARILMEEKQKQEREEAKAIRKSNVAMLKADKFVRENDPNWKSGQSAACVKSGSGISTFRDRFGE